MLFVFFVDNEMVIVVIIDEDFKIWKVEDGYLECKIDIGKIFIDEEYGIIGVVGYLVVFSVYGIKSFMVFDIRIGVKVR